MSDTALYALQRIIELAATWKTKWPVQRKHVEEILRVARSACADHNLANLAAARDREKEELLTALKDLLQAYDQSNPYHRASERARELIKRKSGNYYA